MQRLLLFLGGFYFAFLLGFVLGWALCTYIYRQFAKGGRPGRAGLELGRTRARARAWALGLCGQDYRTLGLKTSNLNSVSVQMVKSLDDKSKNTTQIEKYKYNKKKLEKKL